MKKKQHLDIYQRAVIRFDKEDYQGAIDLFNRALGILPNEKKNIIEDYILKAKNEVEKKGKLLIHKQLSIQYEKGLELYRQKAYKEALTVFISIHALDPSFKDVRLYMRLSEGNAKSLVSNAIVKDPLKDETNLESKEAITPTE